MNDSINIKDCDQGPGSVFYELNSVEDKPLQEGYASNIMYMTNKCNLACTYCYEDLAGRPSQIQTKENIRENVDAVLERESDPDQQTLMVLFGGEATLEWDNCKYLMSYAFSKKKNIHFNIVTNGIRFLSDKFLKEFKNNYFFQQRLLSIDISFDGVGNRERIYHNGTESTSSVIKVFRKLNENGMSFRIRYTFHNLNIHAAYEDIASIAKLFKPYRIITSVAWDTLTDEQVQQLVSVKDRLRDDWINNCITVPVCELFCDTCNGCDVIKETLQTFSDEGNVKIKSWNENEGVFSDFKPKEET